MRVVPVLLLASVLAAQESRPSAPAASDMDMDEVSRAATARWRKLEYHLGRAGVTALAFSVEAQSESPLGKASTTGSYQRAANGKGTLTWRDPSLGHMLAERGFSAAAFDRWLDPDGRLSELKGTKLRGSRHDDGVTVQVEGDNAAGYRALEFDTLGRLSAVTLAVEEAAPGASRTARIGFRYRVSGDHLLVAGWTLELKTTAGALRGEVAITYADVLDYHVVERLVETVKIDGEAFGSQTLRFSDFKINGKSQPAKESAKGPAKGPEKAPAQVPPKPSTKPPSGTKR